MGHFKDLQTSLSVKTKAGLLITGYKHLSVLGICIDDISYWKGGIFLPSDLLAVALQQSNHKSK